MAKPLEKEAYFLRYFQDDDQGGDDEIDVGLLVIDEGSVAVSMSNSSYDQPALPDDGLESVTMLSGDYFLTIVPAPDQSESASNATTLQSGDYLPVVVNQAVNDDGSQPVTMQTGAYTQVVFTDTESDAGNQSVTMQTGVYTQTVFPAGDQADSGNQSVTMQSGAYT